MKILFVCLGNICRSPMAKAILLHKVKQQGLTNIEIDSCGTESYHDGSNADSRTIQVLRNHNIPISHLARKITSHDFQTFDYILAMDASNLSDINNYALPHKVIIQLVTDFDPLHTTYIPDPYYDTIKEFEQVYQQLDRCLNHFLNKIKTRFNPS